MTAARAAALSIALSFFCVSSAGAQAAVGSATPVAADAATADGLARARALFRLYETSHDDAPGNEAREVLRRLTPGPEHRVEHALLSAIVLGRGPDSRMRIGPHPNDWFVDPKSLGSIRSLRLLRSVLAAEPHHREAALELATWAIDRWSRPKRRSRSRRWRRTPTCCARARS